MPGSLWLYAALAVLLTFLGGHFALRLRHHLQWLTSFSSGVLVAVALFRLLPDALLLSHQGVHLELDHLSLLKSMGLGFLFFYVLDLMVPEHHAAGHEDHLHAPDQPRVIGLVGAAILCVHSLIDGLIIGTTGSASEHLAHTVGFAIVFHKFSDGVLVVGTMLRNSQSSRRTWLAVLLTSLCPTFGLLLAHYWPMPTGYLSFALASFAGAFLYLGGSHLAIREHDPLRRFTPLLTVLGFLLVYFFQE